MAWDSKTPRRRAASSATTKTATSEAIITPKSTHTSDPAIRPFLAVDFDPADFLNSTLPPLQTSGTKSRSEDTAVPLAELSTQAQTLLSHLSAHTARLTTTLTQLTDEILRSGSRLAYEVEILRGETLGLSETLTEGLQDDVTKFVPGGLERHLAPRRGSQSLEAVRNRRRSSTLLTTPKTPVPEEKPTETSSDPIYITRLRTLTLVRNRLDTVIQTFGDAMAWTFPPSEVSVGSAFLSVSAPEPGSEAYSIEEKGQEVSKKLRDEIADLLAGGEDPVEGIEAAAQRVERLKNLVAVWHGTAEEKSRLKFVEGLAKMVEDRHRDLLREAEEARKQKVVEASSQDETSRAESSSEGIFGWSGGAQSGYGFINQLQKMRGGL